MEKLLVKKEYTIYHYKDGERIEGVHNGIRGYVTDIRGDIDDCEITDEERAKGIDIKDLVA